MRLFVVMVIIWFCGVLPAKSDDDADRNASEYRIKAALICNFLKFIEWPEKISPGKTGTAHICVIGDKGFSTYFSNLQNFHQQNPAITVNDTLSGDGLTTCHILLIGDEENKNMEAVLTYISYHPVLSISEAKGFANNGGIVEIVKVKKTVGLFSEDKINLRINTKNAVNNGLIIDARLLQIASEVLN